MAFESRGRRWVAIQGLTSLNLIVFVTTSMMISPYWGSINSFLSDATGIITNYVLGIVLLSLAPLVFCFTGFFLSCREIVREGVHTRRNRIIIPSILFAIIYDLLLMLLILLWGNDGVIVLNALEYQIPFVLLILNIGFM